MAGRRRRDTRTAPLLQGVLAVACDAWHCGIAVARSPAIDLLLSSVSSATYRHRGHALHDARLIPLDTIDPAFLEQLVLALQSSGFSDSVADLSDQLANALDNASNRCFSQNLQVAFYSLGSGCALASSADHAGLPAFAQLHQGRYLSAQRLWIFDQAPADTLSAALVDFLELDADQVRREPGVFELTEHSELVAVDTPHIDLGTAGAVAMDDATALAVPLESGSRVRACAPNLAASAFSPQQIRGGVRRHRVLLKHQRKAFRFLASTNAALLGDDVGVGKTLPAIAAAHFVSGGKPSLLVVPTSIVFQWKKAIQFLLPKARVSRDVHDADADFQIITYKAMPWIDPEKTLYGAVVFDEAHRLRNLNNRAVISAMALAQHIPHRYLLTATPITNTLGDLHNLLSLSGHPLSQTPYKDFVRRQDDPAFRAMLREQMGHWMLRRTKAQIGIASTALMEQETRVELSDKQRQQYTRLLLRQDLCWMAKVQKVREFLDQSKRAFARDFVLSLPPGDKVVIFVNYRSTLDALLKTLSTKKRRVEWIHGGRSAEQRERAKERFYADSKTQVMVGLYDSASEGIDFVCANHVLLLGQPWTATKRNQAIGRCDRNGQTRDVFVHTPVVANTVDEDLLDLVVYKQNLSDRLVDPAIVARATQNVMAERIRIQVSHFSPAAAA